MKYLLLILLVIFFHLFCIAQVQEAWVNRYHYNNSNCSGVSIAVDDSGNVFVSGFSPLTYVTIKYNTYGNQQWVQIYREGTASWTASSIAIDDSSNVYVTGTINNGIYGSGFGTIKYCCMGILSWAQSYRTFLGGNDTVTAYMVKVDKLHNVYVTGRSNDYSTFRDYTTIKYSTSGVQQWIVRYNGLVGGVDEASALAVDDSGNVYVTGTSQGNGAQQTDIATVKYNSSGKQQWVQRYIGAVPHSLNRGNAITLDSSGNVFVTGSGTTSGNINNFLTIKYNSSGEQQWVHGYTNGSGNDLTVDNFGNVYVTGEICCTELSIDRATIKYSPEGRQQWVDVYHGPDTHSEGYAIALDDMNNVYTTGRSGNAQTNDDYLTIKCTSAGVRQWLVTYNGPANNYDGAGSIAVDKQRNVYVTGTSTGNNYVREITTIKYSQLVGVHNLSNENPSEYSLSQNFPNPFNPITKIKFSVPAPSPLERAGVRLIIYDILGREIATLVNEQLQPGTYEVEWNASNYPSGMYFYRLFAGDPSLRSGQGFTDTKKMVIVK